MDHDYRNQTYEARGSDSLASQSFVRERVTERPEQYVSYEPRLSPGGRGLYRSGYGFGEPKERVFEDSIEDRYANLYRNRLLSLEGRNQNGSSWEPSYEAERLDRLREIHYSRLAALYNNPPLAGPQGRGMSAYVRGNRGRRGGAGRGAARGQLHARGKQQTRGQAHARGQQQTRGQVHARGQQQTRGQAHARGQQQTRGQAYARGQQQTRGRGRGQRGGFVNTRGAKRKIGQTPTSPGMPMKKRKQNNAGTSPTAKKNLRKVLNKEVKNEQKRRRRDKNIEKNGTNEWKPYLCTFCKFRSYEEKTIEEHFESASHKEMLEYIQKEGELEKAVVDFLHENMLNKYKKIASYKTQSGVVKGLAEPNVLDDAAPDDHMVKSDTVHCSACDVYIPALHFSVQLHLKSRGHINNKEALKDQIKTNSVMTATRMMRNPGIKSRCEMYLKGENPFEEKETEADEGPEAQGAQEEKEIKDTGEEAMQEA